MNPPFHFLRPCEADLIRELIGTIYKEFGMVRFLEVGVSSGDTSRGVCETSVSIGCPIVAVGVDIEDQPMPPPLTDYEYLQGDSMDVHRQIKRRDFNFLFVDGCHCCNHAMVDFLNYSPFVQVGGYCLFHDTALPKGEAAQAEWPQNHGYAGRPPSVLGVREGLTKLGLLQGYRTDWRFVRELPSDDGLMGMCLFRKLADL